MDIKCKSDIKTTAVVQRDWHNTPEGEDFFRKFCNTSPIGRRLYEMHHSISYEHSCRVVGINMSRRLNNESVVALSLLLARRRRRRVKEARKWRIHPALEDKTSYAKFLVLHNRMKEDSVIFFEYYQMSLNSFDTLLSQIEDAISKTNTVMRECVSPVEKLAVTLRYLTTGKSYRLLHLEFFLGCSTIALIVRETCRAIWETLSPEYLKTPVVEDWMKISDEFYRKTQFPHCVGSVSGKYIRIVKPWGHPKEFFVSKRRYSIVLIAVADTDYLFTYIDVGGYRREGDPNLFKGTELGKAVYSKSLSLPSPSPLPGELSEQSVPFVFVTEAFSLCENVLRHFPNRNSTFREALFNKRLDEARNCIETAFAILTTKWKIFQRPLSGGGKLVDAVVKSCCVLHNFVGIREGFSLEGMEDCPMYPIRPCPGGNSIGKAVRNQFVNHFCSTSDFASL